MKKYILLLIVPLLFACGGGDEKKKVEKEISGCTDTLANNYNPEANIDDGSCMSFVGKWSGYKKGRIESFVEFLNDGTMTSQASKDEVMEASWEDTDGQLCVDNECYKYEWVNSNEFLLHAGRRVMTFKKEKSMQDYIKR
tara:strand:- start:52 stop:471 length:420 start_codon:yes stop_codon:yes gene_type:complete